MGIFDGTSSTMMFSRPGGAPKRKVKAPVVDETVDLSSGNRNQVNDPRIDQLIASINRAPVVPSFTEARAQVEAPDFTKAIETGVTGSEAALGPLFQTLSGQTQDILTGSKDISTLPSFASGKRTIESQFKRAQQAAGETGTKGGALLSTLSNLQGQRAGSLGALDTSLFNQATQTGTELAKIRGGVGTGITQSLIGAESNRFGTDIDALLGLGSQEANIFGTEVGGASNFANLLTDIYQKAGQGQGFGETGGRGFGGTTINPEVISGFNNEPSIFGADFWNTPST